jgi:hypothetical protein
MFKKIKNFSKYYFNLLKIIKLNNFKIISFLGKLISDLK